MGSLPNALSEAMLRVLELDCHPECAEAQPELRIQLLREARTILDACSAGRLDTDEAITRIDALVAHFDSSCVVPAATSPSSSRAKKAVR